MSRPLHPISRFLLCVSVLTLAAGYWLPLWQIQLWAPQYPEGLNMKIWINKLSGAFDIINGLNHYIGMAMIKDEMFPEFKFMIHVLGALIALGLFAVIKGTRRWLWTYGAVLASGGIIGLADYYRWGYQYGHHLNPNAAIQVPGMTYQPPLFGYKNLLNFTAYSGPDVGGWILILAGGLTGLVLGWEQLLRKESKPREAAEARAVSTARGVLNVGMALVTTLLFGCGVKPEPIRFGQDDCAECKMIISDQRFGAEVVLSTGRVFKFDDVICMAAFLRSKKIPDGKVKLTLASDFANPGQFVPTDKAVFLKAEALRSPMRGDCAAFGGEADRDAVKAKIGGGQALQWADVKNLK